MPSPYWYTTRQVYAQLPMKNKSILPDEGMMVPEWVQLHDTYGRFEVRILPKPKPGVRWGHRVQALCKCGRWIPFGRMNQHYPTCNN